MAMTNFGTNDPLAVNLWSKSIDVEALKHTDISPLTAAIRAELIADDSCSALGMTVRGFAPLEETPVRLGRRAENRGCHTRFPSQSLASVHTTWDDYVNQRGSHDSARLSTSRSGRPQSSIIIEAGDIGESALQSPKIVKAGHIRGKARCFPSNRSLWPTRILYLSRWVALRSKQTNEVHMNRLAYPLPEAARIAGVSRTRIFEAVRKQELTIRKAGRASIVTHDDLLAWINSLPVKGRRLDGNISAGM